VKALAGFGDVWQVEREMEEVAAQLAVAGGAGGWIGSTGAKR